MWTLPLRGGDIKRISRRMELLEARAMGISRQLWPGELPEGWLRAVSGNAVSRSTILLRPRLFAQPFGFLSESISIALRMRCVFPFEVPHMLMPTAPIRAYSEMIPHVSPSHLFWLNSNMRMDTVRHTTEG